MIKRKLLLLIAAFATLMASAQTKVEINGFWYNLSEETNQAEVTSGGDYSGSITIPATVTYNGMAYSVTSIGDEAFDYCSSLTAITIPEGVTSIGDYAFYECINLTAITIPEGVTSIGDYAFRGCSSLTAITIPEGVTSIGEVAFAYCSSLTAISVAEDNTIYDSRDGCNAIIETESNTLIQGCKSTTIPESVTSIGYGAFGGCSSLTAITIPESVTSIGELAFVYCSSLESITIPKGVTSIGEVAFAYCSSLTAISVAEDNTIYDSRDGCNAIIETESNTLIQGCKSTTIPESVTSIGYGAFGGCSSLTAITIPKGVTSIGKCAFAECSSLTAINIPEDVTSIGSEAFAYCSSLTAINIPKGVTSIGDEAFYECINLTAINIPEDVTSIGSEAFGGCSSLTAIICKAVTPPTIENSYTFYNVDKSIPVYVPENSVEDYKATSWWGEFTNIQPLARFVTEIALSQSTATLTEGESITLTATVTPKDAEDTSITWSSSDEDVAMVSSKGKVIALSAGTAIITATANDRSGVSASCKIVVNEKPLGKCATPVINYVDGQVKVTCDTEDVKVITSVTNGDDELYEEVVFALIPTYAITAYATKENYEDSDEATITLCWLPCTEGHEEDNGILTIPSKPVLIGTQGGVITVSGLAGGTEVAAYDLSGIALTTATARNGTATLATDLTAGTIAIVKIGEHSIKVAIK